MTNKWTPGMYPMLRKKTKSEPLRCTQCTGRGSQDSEQGGFEYKVVGHSVRQRCFSPFSSQFLFQMGMRSDLRPSSRQEKIKNRLEKNLNRRDDDNDHLWKRMGWFCRGLLNLPLSLGLTQPQRLRLVFNFDCQSLNLFSSWKHHAQRYMEKGIAC